MFRRHVVCTSCHLKGMKEYRATDYDAVPRTTRTKRSCPECHAGYFVTTKAAAKTKQKKMA